MGTFDSFYIRIVVPWCRKGAVKLQEYAYMWMPSYLADVLLIVCIPGIFTLYDNFYLIFFISSSYTRTCSGKSRLQHLQTPLPVALEF